mmetsp:Transcript_15157/g.49450  ORF Transcript_15157/g.49450 Transcript_15157/m.49450 type:complete len:404 (-) Transcript_15157:224-1435(-)
MREQSASITSARTIACSANTSTIICWPRRGSRVAAGRRCVGTPPSAGALSSDEGSSAAAEAAGGGESRRAAASATREGTRWSHPPAAEARTAPSSSASGLAGGQAVARAAKEATQGERAQWEASWRSERTSETMAETVGSSKRLMRASESSSESAKGPSRSWPLLRRRRRPRPSAWSCLTASWMCRTTAPWTWPRWSGSSRVGTSSSLAAADWQAASISSKWALSARSTLVLPSASPRRRSWYVSAGSCEISTSASRRSILPTSGCSWPFGTSSSRSDMARPSMQPAGHAVARIALSAYATIAAPSAALLPSPSATSHRSTVASRLRHFGSSSSACGPPFAARSVDWSRSRTASRMAARWLVERAPSSRPIVSRHFLAGASASVPSSSLRTRASATASTSDAL